MKQIVLTGLSVLMGVMVAGSSLTQPHYSVEDTARRTKELQDLQFGMFVCWSFSSFSGYEWTPGVEDINFFAPSGFDADQWVRTAKDAGMGYILFLTKHHDGFCLWNTQTTDRKVTNTKFLPVDVLAELRKACNEHGIKLALYFSEGDWSWNPGNKGIHQSVDRPEIKQEQLRELLTNYGPIEFIWFDHAIGDGGLTHKETVEWVNRIQPGTFCGFNTGETAGRLSLRERGRAGPIGDAQAVWGKNHLKSDYSQFTVAEFTYPILEGQDQQKKRGAQWFFSLPENDNFAAAPEKIYSDYLEAKKYGNLFSLDVGPTRAGVLREIDISTLKKVGQYIRGEIKLPAEVLNINKPITASGIYNDDPTYSAEKANDGNPGTRWGGAEGMAGWLEVDLEDIVEISQMDVTEFAPRVQSFRLLTRNHAEEEWRIVFEGNGLGTHYSKKFGPTKGRHFRLDLPSCSDTPSIWEWHLK